MVKFKLISTLVVIFLMASCKKYEVVSEYYLITNRGKNIEGSTFQGCVVRYSFLNYATKLNETIQKEAVSSAFSIWQKTNENLLFLQSDDISRTELLIEFKESDEFDLVENILPIGLFKTNVRGISSLRQVEGNKYRILLDDTIDWNPSLLQRTISYQIGSYLGFPSSDDSQSIMYLEANQKPISLSKTDSIKYLQKYSLPCKDLEYDLLPLELKLDNRIERKIRLDKVGTVTIESSGVINSGPFIGSVQPDGKFEFDYLGITFDIDASYDIVPDFPHGSVIYQINNDTKWRLCKSKCEFTTDGNEYLTLTLQINDKITSDNSGFYDVEIKYK